MRFLDLRYFIIVMWALVMLACICIIFIIAPISKYQLIQEEFPFIKTSVIQAILAIIIVGGLIIILNKFKKIYLLKKLSNDENN